MKPKIKNAPARALESLNLSWSAVNSQGKFAPFFSGHDPRVAVPEIDAVNERDDDRRMCRVRGRGVRSRSGHRRSEIRRIEHEGFLSLSGGQAITGASFTPGSHRRDAGQRRGVGVVCISCPRRARPTLLLRKEESLSCRCPTRDDSAFDRSVGRTTTKNAIIARATKAATDRIFRFSFLTRRVALYCISLAR